ncbi:hypothetical protein [Sulfitobacter pontiacus]|uniref:hypothetical protein n=1 Tax=Sulfitobacter pontiacus TaxID=60137 RepID=UPI0010FDE590|nr:hypothetical protein [Sulfitobacter pontiacus]
MAALAKAELWIRNRRERRLSTHPVDKMDKLADQPSRSISNVSASIKRDTQANHISNFALKKTGQYSGHENIQ